MTGYHSKGIGSRYVVMRTDREQGSVVSDALVLFPLEDRDAVRVVREAGLTEWADQLDTYWQRIDLMHGPGGAE